MIKNIISILVIGCAVLFSCQPKSETIGTECSFPLPEVKFTRSLNKGDQHSVVENNRLTIRSDAKTDYFNDPDGTQYGNAPMLLAEVDNTRPFTFTAKLTPQLKVTYDAGALYVFSSNNLWQKFAFEKDEQGRTRIVTVRTNGTSDDNNHEVIQQESVYLRISSDTKTIGFYFSLDGTVWNLARLYKNEYPAKIGVGVSAQSPLGEGNVTYFDECSLTDKSIKDFRSGV